MIWIIKKKNIKIKLLFNNFIKKNYFSRLYSLFVSSLVFFSYITFNFEFWRIISPWEELIKLSHSQLFNGIILSVFKPFLHVEKFAGEVCGYECINYVNRITWAIIIYFICLLIIERLKKYFLCSNLKVLKYSSFTILLTLPFLIRSASWGTIVDPIYALGILLVLIASEELFIPKNKSSSKKLLSLKKVAYAILGIWLVDLSRPYGLIAVFMFAVLFVFRKSYKLLISLIIGLLLAMPYHFVHYKNTGNLLFSNFTGCYLASVTKPKNYVPPNNKKSFSSQMEVLEICNKAKKDVFSEYYFSNPKLTLKKIFQFDRIKQILFPPAFAPYKEIPKFTNFIGIRDWSITIILYLFYLAVIFIFLFNLKSSQINLLTKLVLLFIILLPLFSSLIAHHGKEALRHTFHSYIPMLFMSLELGSFNLKQKNQLS